MKRAPLPDAEGARRDRARAPQNRRRRFAGALEILMPKPSRPLTSFAFLLPFVVAMAVAFAAAPEAAAEDAAKPGRIGPGAPPAVVPAPKPSAKRIHLAPTAPIASGVNVHQKTLDECRIQTLLPQSIAERSADVELSDKPGAAKLELTIVDVHAPSGGWFSGPKWITVEGRLLEGKKVKGNFVAKETSMASASACGMLSKVILVLAGDIATWLQNPAKDSRLGSAR